MGGVPRHDCSPNRIDVNVRGWHWQGIAKWVADSCVVVVVVTASAHQQEEE